MSAFKGLTILSSFGLLSAAALHSTKRSAVDFSPAAVKLDSDFGYQSRLPTAKDGVRVAYALPGRQLPHANVNIMASANLTPAALAGRARQL